MPGHVIEWLGINHEGLHEYRIHFPGFNSLASLLTLSERELRYASFNDGTTVYARNDLLTPGELTIKSGTSGKVLAFLGYTDAFTCSYVVQFEGWSPYSVFQKHLDDEQPDPRFKHTIHTVEFTQRGLVGHQPHVADPPTDYINDPCGFKTIAATRCRN